MIHEVETVRMEDLGPGDHVLFGEDEGRVIEAVRAGKGLKLTMEVDRRLYTTTEDPMETVKRVVA